MSYGSGPLLAASGKLELVAMVALTPVGSIVGIFADSALTPRDELNSQLDRLHHPGRLVERH